MCFCCQKRSIHMSRQICKNRQCDSVKDLTNIQSEYGQSIDAIALWGNFVGILRWEGIIISPTKISYNLLCLSRIRFQNFQNDYFHGDFSRMITAMVIFSQKYNFQNYYSLRPRLVLISCVSQEFASRISRMIISMVIFPE